MAAANEGLHNFHDFCKRLDSALDDPPADNKSNKTSGQEKGNMKRSRNNSNSEDKKHYCMLHRHKTGVTGLDFEKDLAVQQYIQFIIFDVL